MATALDVAKAEPDGVYPLPPGYQVPSITTWDTPWFLKGNLSTIPPPPGVLPNFVDPVSQHIWLHVTLGVCLPIATLLVAMRLYTKIFFLKTTGWEDWCSLAGWAGLIVNSGILLLGDQYGAGTHLWDIKGDTFVKWVKTVYVLEIIYGPIIYAIKLAILLLYLRVFQPIRGTYICLHIIVWANLAFYAIGTFVEIFQCAPIQKVWFSKWPGTCFDQKAIQLSSAGINILSDLSILVLPIWSVRDLQTSKQRKVGLFGIFAFGALYVLIYPLSLSVVRLVRVLTASCQRRRSKYCTVGCGSSIHMGVGCDVEVVFAEPMDVSGMRDWAPEAHL